MLRQQQTDMAIISFEGAAEQRRARRMEWCNLAPVLLLLFLAAAGMVVLAGVGIGGDIVA